jgi:nicotinamidase-related amidase
MTTALLIIDLQAGLFDQPGKPGDYENVLRNVNMLSDYARKQGFPVIFIQHEQPAGPLQFGSAGWQLVPELLREGSDILLRKTTPNAFVRTPLDSLLREHSVTNLIVCGYASEFCVDSTVRGAAALGYSVQIAADAHMTNDKRHATAELIRTHHNATLSDIVSFGVPITAIATAEILQGS